jgi:amino acid adenylation domain-containing protein/non-ribosomal peptide synthase protein (TIGR01720 family)
VPLFENILVFENYPIERPEGGAPMTGNLRLSRLQVHERTHFPMTVIASLRGESMTFKFMFDRAAIDQAGVERLAAHLERALSTMCDPGRRILSDVSLLTEAERQQLLVEWNDTASNEVDHSLTRIFERQARRTPDSVALSYTGEHLSYVELERRANRLARFLRDRGVSADTRVGICLSRSLEMGISVLAVLKAGGAYVPLDPTYPEERLRFMVEDAGILLLVSTRRLLTGLPELGASTILLDEQTFELGRYGTEAPGDHAGSDHLAYVIYTSGSTGRPKGAALSHRALGNLIEWHHDAHERGGKFLQFASLSFDASFHELFGAWRSGGTAVVIPEDQRRDMEALARFLVENDVEKAILPVVAFLNLAEMFVAESRGPRALGEASITGEALQLTDAAVRLFEMLPGCRLYNEYGPSETHVITSFCFSGPPATWPVSPPIGRSIRDTRIYLLDPDMGPVPLGPPGQLFIGGASVGRCYLAQPRLTAERFVPDPLAREPGARLYRSGDLARWRGDGAILFLGRIDHQVKIRGHRVELGEIEVELRAHPDVAEAVVIARPDARGNPRLVAYFVPSSADAASGVELRRRLEERLPHFMIPAKFVSLAALPLTPTGKVDRKSLPSPEQLRPELEEAFVEPGSPMETELARIWREVLGLDRVGIHDNFFELGGDSIVCIQVVGKASQAGIRITPTHIFQHQTIAELARVATQAAAVRASNEPVTGRVPLTPIQRWFFDQELPDPHHWNMSVFLDVRRKLDAGCLKRAVSELVRHHDALRMRFHRSADGWQQENGAPEAVDGAFCHLELSQLSGSARKTAIEGAASELQASLDLDQGPLLRVAFIETGEDSDRLLLVVHHLVVDGVSWRVLLADLFTFYQGLDQKKPVGPPAKTTSFQDWGRRLVEQGASRAMNDEIPYWLGMAAPAEERLPLDHDRGPNEVASSDSVAIELGADETEALLREAPRAYHTQINDLLLAALAQALCRWTKSGSVLVALEGHGREDLFADLDLSRTVGWFTAIYPMRLSLAEADGPISALQSIKEQLRSVPRRGIGYGVLRYLGGSEEIETKLGAINPEINFNYLGQLDQALPQGFPLTLAAESKGHGQAGRGVRAYLLEIFGGVAGGQLRMFFRYSRNRHLRSTIERLAAGFGQSLRELIEHCRKEESIGYTPSDFPLARLDQGTLDELASEAEPVDDIYPTTPLQSGLLFESLYDSESSTYFEQVSCTFEGPFDVAAFRKAWGRVMERHGVLRSAFRWSGLKEPVQVVFRRPAIPWLEADLQAIAAERQRGEVDRFLEEDRIRGFDFTAAPLMRVAVFRLDDRTFRFVWSHHHLVLDGWSLPLLMKELMLIYAGIVRGIEIPMETPPSYRDYVVWMREQDPSRVEAYWRGRLEGFTTPTRLAMDRAPEAAAPRDGTGLKATRLSRKHTAALESMARSHRITIATLIQGAWALLLSRYGGSSDVLFGVTVSGRSAPVEGIDTMLGLFINALPVRVEVRDDALLVPWLQKLQSDQVEMRTYEHSRLFDIQGFCAVPRNQRLFESIVIFENYPRLERSMTAGGSPVTVRDVKFPQRTPFPMTLGAVPRAELALALSYQRRRFDDEAVARAVEHLETLLVGFTENERGRLADVPMLSEKEERRVLLEWGAARSEATSEEPEDLEEMLL